MNRVEDVEKVRERIHYSAKVRARFISLKRKDGYNTPGDLPQFDEAALRRAFLSLSNRMGLVGSGKKVKPEPQPKAEITPIRPDITLE